MSDKQDDARPGPKRWLSAPAVALMFLTRLPVRGPQAGLAGAVVAFPLVGILVGALGGGAFWLASFAGLPALACALIALAATVVVTGALHEDGLADAADGLAGHTPEDSIRIMRDSHIGGYGVLAMVFSVGLRAAALAAIGNPLAVVMTMTAVGAVSRAAMPAVMLALPRATSTGLGAAAGKPATADTLFGITVAALLAFALLGTVGTLAILAAATIATLVIAALARRRLGGYTGDILGAVQQMAEIAALLTFAAVM
ncbi:MAG: adenosylcobinamide-GDP ribazoletransferase [Proteobacteria bacterium]|nr:adenosylcobinamide-GDP ribazoletransferase [Pseudomonadota bacterium]